MLKLCYLRCKGKSLNLHCRVYLAIYLTCGATKWSLSALRKSWATALACISTNQNGGDIYVPVKIKGFYPINHSPLSLELVCSCFPTVATTWKTILKSLDGFIMKITVHKVEINISTTAYFQSWNLCTTLKYTFLIIMKSRRDQKQVSHRRVFRLLAHTRICSLNWITLNIINPKLIIKV